MKSNLATRTERALQKHIQALSHEERLNAFLMHSQLMIQLYRSGEKVRQQTSHSTKPS